MDTQPVLDVKPQLLVDAKAAVGECPVWDVASQLLYWVDIERGQIHIYDPRYESDTAIEVGCRVGCVAVRERGGLLLGTENGFETLNPADSTSHRTLIAQPEPHLPHNRMNDGKCDPVGRFLAGTMSMKKEQGAGSLYVLERDYPQGEFAVRALLSGVTTSNGLAWDASGATLYYIDTPTRRVDALDYDVEDGAVAGRRPVIMFPEGAGRPDGMTIDAEGMLWIAHFDGGRVSRWNPLSQELLAVILLPVQNVTSCCFGGPNLDRLFITTARQGLSPDQLAAQPLAGGLFAVEPGVRGVPMTRFRG